MARQNDCTACWTGYAARHVVVLIPRSGWQKETGPKTPVPVSCPEPGVDIGLCGGQTGVALRNAWDKLKRSRSGRQNRPRRNSHGYRGRGYGDSPDRDSPDHSHHHHRHRRVLILQWSWGEGYDVLRTRKRCWAGWRMRTCRWAVDYPESGAGMTRTRKRPRIR